MQRTIIVLAIVVISVGFLGFVALPWLQTKLFGGTSDVRVTVLSAVRDDDVGVPGTKESVSRIVAEMEIVFPYGMAPDSIGELSVRDDNEAVVDVNWGPTD